MAESRDPLLQVRELRKTYGERVITEVLKGIDFDLSRGEFCALTGPSGSGKTTLLNLIGLLDRPSSGRMLLESEGATARKLISELHSSARRSELIGELVADWHALFVDTVKDRVPPGAGSPEAVCMAINVILAGLSYVDVYDSMPADPAEVRAIINRIAAAILAEVEPNG